MVNIILVPLWTAMAIQPNLLQAKGIQVLPPVNFTLTVTALAEVLLHWKPNPDQHQNYTVIYEVEIITPVQEEYNTKHTHSTRTVVLHDGFCAQVRTRLSYNNSQIESEWVTEELPALAGDAGTSVTNLFCIVYTASYNTASLHCSWLAGEHAPTDTVYFLFYRYNNYTEQCPDYLKDKWQRNVGCRFSKTYIDPKQIDTLIIIHVNGSSKHAAIKPLEQLFNQNTIEKINPPRNVTISLEQNDILVTWEKPISPFPKAWFCYEVTIHNLKTGKNQLSKSTSNDFRFRMDVTSRYSIQIRANRQYDEGFWSEWTDPLFIGEEQKENQVGWVLILVTVTMCFITLLIAMACKMCHLWSRLFPPIPTPKNNLKDLFSAKDYEIRYNFSLATHRECYTRARTYTSETETEVGSYIDDLGSYNEDLYCEVLEDSVI
ncbi:PREDICTED: interleukin-5 receptor subunit alpha [Crocodylus porosus]|uniref:interleukin-5 receptor subunit alpha n=1 Tax=Crocodylus porosus TaxID=8502 RepID=UPI00093F4A9F|nr:PREDICTED: interleukin-5 receptor subunit alpha [Crocodylus porosus]